MRLPYLLLTGFIFLAFVLVLTYPIVNHDPVQVKKGIETLIKGKK